MPKYSLKAFWLCIAGYVIVGFVVNMPSVRAFEWNISAKLLFVVLSVPMFAVGLMMQIIPGVYLENFLSNSSYSWVSKRAGWVWGIWVLTLVVYCVFVIRLP